MTYRDIRPDLRERIEKLDEQLEPLEEAMRAIKAKREVLVGLLATEDARVWPNDATIAAPTNHDGDGVR